MGEVSVLKGYRMRLKVFVIVYKVNTVTGFVSIGSTCTWTLWNVVKFYIYVKLSMCYYNS